MAETRTKTDELLVGLADEQRALIADFPNWASHHDIGFLEESQASLRTIEAARQRHAAQMEALRKAAAQFRWYEELHAAKGATDKAARNRQMAETCEAALAAEEVAG